MVLLVGLRGVHGIFVVVWACDEVGVVLSASLCCLYSIFLFASNVKWERDREVD